MIQTFEYLEEEKNRLDKYLTIALKDYSRNQVQEWIETGLVKINSEVNDKSKATVRLNDKIEIDVPEIIKKTAEDYDVPNIKIIHEAENFIVINKPAGLLSHGVPERNEPSVVEQILEKYPEIKGIGDDDIRPGIVHRIDKMVSGLLVIARNQESFENLKTQFKDRTIDKTYLALCHGNVETPEGTINFALARNKNKARVIAVPEGNDTPNARPAITTFQLLKHYRHLSLVKVKILTGRTHQIRAHFHAFNHPLVGDRLYYNKTDKQVELPQIFLHAHELAFTDLDGKRHEFVLNLPTYLKQYLNRLTASKNLLVVSGASGVGKSAIIIDLLKKYKSELQLDTGTTYTTRELREIPEDKQIINVDVNEFKRLIHDDEFVEWAEVHKNFYGTVRKQLETELKNNNVILNIDINGALQIQEAYPESWLVFIDAPLEDLEQRLRDRKTNTEEDIEVRLKNAKKEKLFAKHYDKVIQNRNNKMDEAVEEFKDYIKLASDKTE